MCTSTNNMLLSVYTRPAPFNITTPQLLFLVMDSHRSSISPQDKKNIFNKLAPCGTDCRLFANDASAEFTWHKNWDKYKKCFPIKFRQCALVWESAVSCQLVWSMAEETAFGNGRIANFKC